MISKLNILEFSDVHLGHRNTDTAHIVSNLQSLIKDVPSLSDIDLMIIAGDLFDRLLNLSLGDVYIIHRWVYSLLQLCKKHDIVLRVLEGTPSHDNAQNRIITEINEGSNIGCDVKYFYDLSIEHIERFDIDVLYIRDEYHPDPKQTLAEVRELMTSRGLKQVDFAVMHGQFDYQVPANLLNRITHHDSKAYLELVKYLIFIGHVHQHSQYERIIASGSTDRLQHGEEEDKGIIKVCVHSTGDYEAEFIVNHGAKVYKTIDTSSQDLSTAMANIEKVVKSIPEGSHIRIRSAHDESIVNAIRELKLTHPQIRWSMLTDKSAVNRINKVIAPETSMQNLTADNIPKLVREDLEGMYDAQTIDDAVTIMKEIIHGDGTGTNPTSDSGKGD